MLDRDQLKVSGKWSVSYTFLDYSPIMHIVLFYEEEIISERRTVSLNTEMNTLIP